MQRSSTTLVLLSYDEREALELLLPRIDFSLFESVFAVDGGSTDGTLDVYERHGIPCCVQEERGRGRAFQLVARLVDTERVVFLSVDGNEDPRDLAKMLEGLDGGADLVIGCRFLLDGSASDDSDDPLRLRKTGNIVYSTAVRWIWGGGAHDAINGYRAFRVDSMKRMALDAPYHEIELQSTIRAAKLGLRIAEFPTRELERLGGVRKPSAGTLKLGWRLGAYLARELWIDRGFTPQSDGDST